MDQKPTYEELERRVQELESAESDRKRISETLQEREARFRLLYERAPLGYQSLDENGCFIEVNKAWLDTLGYSHDEVIGKSFGDFLHPDWVDHFKENFPRFKAVGEILGVEFEMVKKDGTIILVSFNGKIGKDSTGRFRQTHCILHDITERKRAEEALRESEKLYRHLFDQANEGIVLMALDRRLHRVNQAFAEMHGYSVNELKGMDIRDLDVLEERLMEDHPDIIRRIEAGETVRFEVEHYHKDGHIFRLTVTASMIDIEGERYFLAFHQDLTEREQAQMQILQAQKMESVGRLAGGVAHDYNNMLSIIVGFTELALEKTDPAQTIHADLTEVLKAARRSTAVTRQLLAFARSQAIAPEVLDLNGTIDGMLKMLRPLLGEDIDLTWLPETDLWPVKMDPTQIDQILANLCVNARDAITNTGRITIETGNVVFDDIYCEEHLGFVPGDYVMLSVSDNGSGMDEETRSHIFEPFFTTKDVGKGTGLGLATVYGIAKQNNGFINVYSEPGVGTTFWIYLPRQASPASEAKVEIKASISTGNGQTVLVAEDEVSILRMSKMMLEKLGYKVLAANNPDEAIRLARDYNGEIHLLITDVVMPGMNGRELSGQIRALRPAIRCLFMSGYTADVIAQRGVLDKGMHFIQKPFSRKELAAKIREALDQ